ncbi:hypothetical protein [Acinetobacter baumannii]|uniref:hypothetical protein n=1 Tax=Acinetobacter baumannii TaxID=470 RepID=UPI0024492EB6|nr:hypothetical protein [Acinetobacter baumannii]MDH2647738.1 hypothetical protein [Acinetobacter baumannii]
MNKEREAFEGKFPKPHWIEWDEKLGQYISNHVSDVVYQARFEVWLEAKAQALPTWILASTTLPEEGEDVLFLDTHNIIHEGCLNTDYADGPYGENGEDLGGNLTLWTSNSNGEEFLLEEVKFWMVRPSNPKIGESGAKQ